MGWVGAVEHRTNVREAAFAATFAVAFCLCLSLLYVCVCVCVDLQLAVV